MKNKNIKYLAILILCICLTGCFNKKAVTINNPLIKIRKEMLKDVKNYSYDVIVKKQEKDKEEFLLNMNCKNDLVHKTNYCITYNDGYNKEKYINFKDRLYYSRLIYFENNNTLPWEKNTRYTNTNINFYINIVDKIINVEKVDEENGKYYTGKINQKTFASIVEEADTDINPDYVENKNVPISIYVNENGIIEKISGEIFYKKTNDIVEIIFKDINATDDVVIPEM